jgi:hypothetical protein
MRQAHPVVQHNLIGYNQTTRIAPCTCCRVV